MFGFKKTQPPKRGGGSEVVKLCEIYEDLNNDIIELYSGFDRHNPAELRFFTMSAVSVFMQSLGNLAENDMRELVGKFIEQCLANMLLHMPRVEYSRLHNAFIERFPAYPELIVSVFNAQTGEDMQQSTFLLVSTIDQHIGVERDAIDVSMAGLKMSAILTDLAINVRNAVASA